MVVSVTDVACNGEANGAIDISTNGGTAPYSFSWADGSTDEDRIGLVASGYALTVTDANGCTASTSATVGQPASLALSMVSTDVSAVGVCDGTATVTATGGTAPYDYEWSLPLPINAPSVSGLCASNYTCKVEDTKGCEAIIALSIGQPSCDSFAIDVVTTDVTCFGFGDGTADVVIAGGGVAPYSVHWSSGSTGLTTDLLGPADYSVVVTDAEGCVDSTDFEIKEPALLQSSSVAIDATCHGDANGAIDLTVFGGVGGYSFNWGDGPVVEDRIELEAGVYTVEITDANGCVVIQTAEVGQPDLLLLEAAVSDAQCHGAAEGMIVVEPTGGNGDYSFDWGFGDDQNYIAGVPAGNYTVTVTDRLGCAATSSYTVDQPDALVAQIEAEVLFHGHHVSSWGGSDGTATVEVIGGVAPYTYQWSTGAEGATIEGLTAGEYSVLVIDANGCETWVTIRLTQPERLAIPTGFSPNGDGWNDAFEIIGIDAYPDNRLMVFNRWGQKVYEESGYHNTWRGEHTNGEKLPDATYFVILEIEGEELRLQTYVDMRRQ